MIYRLLSTITLLVSLFFCANAQKKIIPFNSNSIYYEGRIKYDSDAAELSWPGNSVNIRFEGTGVSAILKDGSTANYLNVVVDCKVG